ncbi:MAG: rhodanese-like domain-containing protein [Deltaproteobacteria bacterium]|nr:rhodanese-like domain-containing protein [Deltaproteobacteria bacterium]
MNSRYPLMALMVLIFLTGLIAKPGKCDERLTDQQNKEIVYKMYEDYRQEFPNVREVSPQEAMKEAEEGKITFVDIRKPAEMAVSMLPGAIPQKTFLKNPRKFKGKRIVAYCTISYRSGIFARDMAAERIEIFNLRGGLLAWVLEGGKVYDAEGETKRINVYGKKWDYPPEGYESVVLGIFERHF